MNQRLKRVEMLLGAESIKRLEQSVVAVVGIGGVGGFAAEALARSGVGTLIICDGDRVEESNMNRQLVAAASTIGQAKTEVMKARLEDIAPGCAVEAYNLFISTGREIPIERADYVIDAIDDVKAKIALIKLCHELGRDIICSMGAGNRIWPNAYRICDIHKTDTDPLAKSVRRHLREEGVDYPVLCVCSSEKPVDAGAVPASLMPSAAGAGLLMASHVISCICGKNK